MKVIEKYLSSSDGIHSLYVKEYIPEETPKGIVQFVHGMTEHIERYHPIMEELCRLGFVAIGHNHLGHKLTSADEDLGFISKDKGYRFLLNDVLVVANYITDKYSNLKHFLFGHSMGSFVVRLAATKMEEKLSGLIICGTGGYNPASGLGIEICKAVKKVKGERYVSKLVYDLAFSTYNKNFDGGEEYAWLSQNGENIENYKKDKYCTFKFTVSAMQDLITLNMLSNKKAWYKKISKKLPIFIISGEMDPVGNYSKGVKEVYKKLMRVGANARLKLYPKMRHEILMDDCRAEVITDVTRFISENL